MLRMRTNFKSVRRSNGTQPTWTILTLRWDLKGGMTTNLKVLTPIISDNRMTSKILNLTLFGARKTKKRAVERRIVRKKRRTIISLNNQDSQTYLRPLSLFQSRRRRIWRTFWALSTLHLRKIRTRQFNRKLRNLMKTKYSSQDL